MLLRYKKTDKAIKITIEEKRAFLEQPGVYPYKTEKVVVKETHMSWVFLAGSYVYKLKKPVAYDQFDHRTLRSRQINSKEEVRINKPLAPDVYLGIVPLVLNKEGKLQLEGKGTIVDWLVKMKRLPEENMLDYALRQGSVPEDAVKKVAALLAGYYQWASPFPLQGRDYIQAMENAIKLTCVQLSLPLYTLSPSLLLHIHKGLLRFLAANDSLFLERVNQKKIIDAHGDLRPEHICLRPEPLIIDRLEFSKALRRMDTAEELSYLDMECEMLGNRQVGEVFFTVYQEITGDRIAAPLKAFYKARRAFARAYLVVRHLDEERYRSEPRWLQNTNRYLKQAARYLQAITG